MGGVAVVTAAVGSMVAWRAPATAESELPEAADAQYTFCVANPEPGVAELTRLFDTEPAGVVGADYQRAHALGDGRVLWTFQDAEIRQPDGGFRRIHNLGVLQDHNCFTVLYSGTRSNPRAWLFAAETTPLKHWFWPLDSALGSDGRLYVYVAEMVERSPTGYLEHTEPISTRVAVFDPATNSVAGTETPPDSSAALYGWSTATDTRWTYLYAHCYRQFGFDAYIFTHAFDASCAGEVRVARVPRGDLWATAQYWDGGRWQADPGRAAPLRGLADDRVNASQFTYTGNRFWVVDKEGDWWGDTTYVYVADTATGPFRQIAAIPEPRKCADCNTFFADWVPPEAIARPAGTLVFGLSHNRWTGEVTADYRPTFHTVRGVPYPVDAGQTLRVHVADAGSGNPDDAAAAAINVTAVDPAVPGYLTVFPCGAAVPLASNVNYGQPGRATATANLAISALGPDGDVCVYSSASADVVIDLAGTFGTTSDDADDGFVPATAPRRLVDTRDGTRPDAGGVVEIAVPADAAAASGAVLNLTAVTPDGPGFLTAYPCAEGQPPTSNLNYLTGDIVAALAVVAPDAYGKVCVYTHAAADVVVDYAGAFTGGAYTGLTSAVRLADTRESGTAGDGVTLHVALPDDIDGTATLTVTAVEPAGPGFLTVHACDQALPTASNVNYAEGRTTGRATANLVLATPATDHTVCVYTATGTDVLVDLAGTLTPGHGYTSLPNPRRLIDTRVVGFDHR